jgi:AcrR family transcriptional regulator
MSTTKQKVHEISPFPDERAQCDGAQCAHDRIFDAARKLFYKFGIRGVTVDAIAAEADTTKVTLYRVYESKEALVCEVLEDQAKRFWTWWDSVLQRHAGEPRAQIEALFDELRECMSCSGTERGCPLTNAAVELVEDEHPARELIRRHKGDITKRLRDLCREMGARQPDVLGDSLALLMNGIFAARVGGDGAEQVSSVYDAAKALIESPALGVVAPKKKRQSRAAD